MLHVEPTQIVMLGQMTDLYANASKVCKDLSRNFTHIKLKYAFTLFKITLEIHLRVVVGNATLIEIVPHHNSVSNSSVSLFAGKGVR